MAFIEVIDYPESTGELREIYDGLLESRGKLAEVHKIQSLNPKSILNHMDLYMTIMFGKSPLRRYQREMIAVVVSVSNKCKYCTEHHSAALNHFWKDDERTARFTQDRASVGLDEKDGALCNYAQVLTETPNEVKKEEQIAKLKALGLKDRAILDAALIIAYFNFVNRLVLGLGVELEAHSGEGFKYD